MVKKVKPSVRPPPTAADAFAQGGLAAVAAAPPAEAPAVPEHVAAPAVAHSPTLAEAVAAELRAVEPAPAVPVTVGAFYRLFPEQIAWLNEQAWERKKARGGKGRADASEVLRVLLATAMGTKAS